MSLVDHLHSARAVSAFGSYAQAAQARYGIPASVLIAIAMTQHGAGNVRPEWFAREAQKLTALDRRIRIAFNFDGSPDSLYSALDLLAECYGWTPFAPLEVADLKECISRLHLQQLDVIGASPEAHFWRDAARAAANNVATGCAFHQPELDNTRPLPPSEMKAAPAARRHKLIDFETRLIRDFGITSLMATKINDLARRTLLEPKGI